MNNPNLHNPQFDPSPFMLKGGSTAILMLHGFTATPHEVRKISSNLNRAGFSVAGPMIPGHGDNPGVLNKTRWQDWYEGVEANCQDLLKNYQKVYVGGESMGGLLALLLAARNPGVAGALTYAPALQIPMSRMQALQLRIFAPFILGMPKKDLAENQTWQGYKINPLKSVIQLRALQKVVRKELANIHQPVLVLQGKKDDTIDLRSADLVIAGVSSSIKELHWMPESGHCVLLDKEIHIATRLTMDFIWKT